MRKKLLALLMCATMVLGTGVTAFADTAADAKKIGGENADNFMAEYWKGDSEIVKTVYNAKTKGTVEYGYRNDAKGDLGKYTAVVVYKKDGVYYEATQVAKSYNAFEVDSANKDEVIVNATNDTFAEQKASLEKVYGETAVKTMYKTDTDGKDKFYNDDKGTLLEVLTATSPIYSKAADGTFSLVTTLSGGAVATADQAIQDTAQAVTQAIDVNKAAVGNVAVTVYEAKGGSVLYLANVTTAGDASGNGAATVVAPTSYVAGTKMYVQYGTNNNLVKGSTKLLKATDADHGTIYTSIKAAGEGWEQEALMAALDEKQITKDAVAVQVKAYYQLGYATEELAGLESKDTAKALPLYDSTKITCGEYTFDSDLITRTGFKDAAAVNVFKITPVAIKFVESYGKAVKALEPVATVAVDKTIVFDNTANWTDGFFVFDKGELVAEPETNANDGVSDTTATTTPAADNTASPKTGDVAPIAALAVVMMGAFGAMVVASKKRA